MLKEWLRDALKTSGTTQADLARHLTKTLGRSIDRAAVNKMLSGRRKLAADEMVVIGNYLNTTVPGANDEVRLAEIDPPIEPGQRPSVPVVGTAAGALIPANGESAAFEGFLVDTGPIQYAHLPRGLAGQKEIYAIFVVGDSMDPMHPPGDIRFVQPHRPPAPGDTVIVQTKHWDNDPGQAYIKVFRRRAGGKILLEQINPNVTLAIPVQYVEAMHRVVPNNEMFGL